MKNLFNKLFDKITISQEVWNTAAAITLHNTHQEWYGMLVGRVDLIPNKSNPLINNIKVTADRILIPEQKVTSGDVQIDQAATAQLMTDEVLTAMRENKQRIIGWIHSHASMNVFLSGTDMSNINDELAMLPLTLSIVVAHSQNTEYHPESKTAPATQEGLEEVMVFHLRSNKRKRVLKAFHKTKLISKTSYKELQKTTKKAKDWVKAFIKFLHIYGIVVVDDRADKSSKGKLDNYISVQPRGDDEFHMGIWFSHRPPFSERKVTSENLAQYEAHKIINWPKKMPRQQADLDKLLTAETKAEIELALPKIQAKFTAVDYSYYRRPFGIRHRSIQIAPEYMTSVAASISRTAHLPDHIRPVRMSARITEIDVASRFRGYVCPLCNNILDVIIGGGCEMCEETEDVRMELTDEYAQDLEIDPRDIDYHVDIEEDDRFKEEVQQIYNAGGCADCPSSQQIEMFCVDCDTGFEIGKEANQAEVNGQICVGCDNQLIYVYHLFNGGRDYVGFMCACEACDQIYVYDYDMCDLMPLHVWVQQCIEQYDLW